MSCQSNGGHPRISSGLIRRRMLMMLDWNTLYCLVSKTQKKGKIPWKNTINIAEHVMSSSVTAYPIPWGCGVLLLEPIPASSQGEGRVLPGQVASLSQGPHWWATWGSVSRSRTLRHAAWPGLWTSDLLITSQPPLPAELQSPLI